MGHDQFEVERSALAESLAPAARRRHGDDTAMLCAELEYVRARRRFTVWIMKRTGLRPGELATIPLGKNKDVLTTLRICIPTLKRRKRQPPLREFKIKLKDATVFQRYLISRATFVAALKKRGTIQIDPDALLLGRDGQPLKKTSVERDFGRLVTRAGHRTRACLSMFRHRFITIEVIVHLKEFMGASGKVRQFMTDGDYRSILRRVVAKTGHGSVMSLWHYIDIAWRELNIWGSVDRALDRLAGADALYEDLLDLQRRVALKEVNAPGDVLEAVTRGLASVISDARQRVSLS